MFPKWNNYHKYLSFFSLAVLSLKGNKIRTYLSMLGIVIGISAIIVAFAVGSGGKSAITRQLDQFGSNRIYLSYDLSFSIPTYTTKKYPLTKQDLEYIKARCPAVNVAAPIIAIAAVTKYHNKNRVARVFGTDESYKTFREGKMLYGRYFTDEEVNTHQKVVILGQTFYEKVFQDADPIGKKILINNMQFIVIGVTKREDLFSNAMTSDYYDYLIIPISIIAESENISKLDAIVMSADSVELIDQAKKEVKELLLKIKGKEAKEYYKLEDMKKTRNMIDKLFQLIMITIGVIASISLVVGGIGIMNVMFITVSERTREIGIEKALGAQRKDILLQFVCESLLMSVIGGFMGIAYGILSSFIVSRMIHVPYVVTLKLILFASLFATVIGVFFGLYPAFKAAKLRPADALRYE